MALALATLPALLARFLVVHTQNLAVARWSFQPDQKPLNHPSHFSQLYQSRCVSGTQFFDHFASMISNRIYTNK